MEHEFHKFFVDTKDFYELPHGGILNDARYFFPSSVKQIRKKHISDAHQRIRRFYADIQEIARWIDEDRDITPSFARLIHHAIAFAKREAQMFQFALYLEAEKRGYRLSDDERNYYQEMVDIFQDDLYGPRISDIPEEVGLIVTHLKQLLSTYEERVTVDQRARFALFLNNHPTEGSQHSREIIHRPSLMVPRKYYTQVFEKAFEFYGLHDWKVVFKEQAYVSVNDTRRELKLPTRAEYDTLSLQRVCELIDHEIGTHALRGENKKNTFGINFSRYL